MSQVYSLYLKAHEGRHGKEGAKGQLKSRVLLEGLQDSGVAKPLFELKLVDKIDAVPRGNLEEMVSSKLIKAMKA